MTRKISDLLSDVAVPVRSQLLVEVEFGVPSRGCINYGICRIELARSGGRRKAYRRPCGSGLALASASAGEGAILQLAFLPSSLSDRARERHFSRGCFRVEEAFPLPSFLHQQLGLPATAIATGAYGILNDEKFLTVSFFNLITL